MTLQEAHEIQRREKIALQYEVKRLTAKIAEYDAGTYVSAEKTKLRVSGQYCSIKAAEYFADIRTYTETCSRNGISPFDALSRLMAGNPYSLDEVLSSGDCE